MLQQSVAGSPISGTRQVPRDTRAVDDGGVHRGQHLGRVLGLGNGGAPPTDDLTIRGGEPAKLAGSPAALTKSPQRGVQIRSIADVGPAKAKAPSRFAKRTKSSLIKSTVTAGRAGPGSFVTYKRKSTSFPDTKRWRFTLVTCATDWILERNGRAPHRDWPSQPMALRTQVPLAPNGRTAAGIAGASGGRSGALLDVWWPLSVARPPTTCNTCPAICPSFAGDAQAREHASGLTGTSAAGASVHGATWNGRMLLQTPAERRQQQPCCRTWPGPGSQGGALIFFVGTPCSQRTPVMVMSVDGSRMHLCCCAIVRSALTGCGCAFGIGIAADELNSSLTTAAN